MTFWSFVTLSWVGGCSVIVPGDVPDFQCTPADPTSCPSGLVCDPASLVCASPATVFDAGEDVLDEGAS
ncbi:MAG TPA: hypothetical protein VM925_01130, partial [Labilithrix sp.]|nr:hypothetical protein [Labilithrix sp.]